MSRSLILFWGWLIAWLEVGMDHTYLDGLLFLLRWDGCDYLAMYILEPLGRSLGVGRDAAHFEEWWGEVSREHR